jgi:uncharacterized membrane protein
LDWPTLVRRYVWDEERTPYFVRSDRLTRAQARSELFAYAFFLAILASVVTVLATVGQGRADALASPLVALYAVTIVLAAVGLGVAGHPTAAYYCGTAPVALGLGALAGVLRPGMAGGEMILLAGLSALWLGYAARVVRVARRLHGLD